MSMYDLFERRQYRRRFRMTRNNLKFITTMAVVGFFVVVAAVLFVIILFAWYAKDLPRPDKVQRTTGLSTVILDRSGESLYDIYQDANRIPVAFTDIPQYCKEGTIAIEDKAFYSHPGLSMTGIIRALLSDVFSGNLQGGSTLTQQLVKTVLLTNERTVPRKIKEAILAIQIEQKYSKDQILQMYLNEAPYGGTTAGMESASQLYFGTPVKDLNLIQCAILAGFPQDPNDYSPFLGAPKAYVARTQHVLTRMREDGYITPVQEADARKLLDTIQFATDTGGLRAPHFIAYVKEQLVAKFGAATVDGGGLRVTTSLDWKLQQKAQQIVKEEVDKVKYLKVSNGAAVVIDPKTGEILAMVGSKDYSATDSSGYKYNVVTQGLRQPGSSIKPFTYATAFKKGYTAATLLMDVSTKYPSGDPVKPEYNPKNYDGKFRGPIQLRYALGNSINTIAVKVSALVGVKDVLTTANDMGISSLAPTNDNLRRLGLSMTLGGGEVTLLDLTSAYGVFATAGMRAAPVSILKVEDRNGKVIYQYTPPSPQRVISADVSYMISDILSDNDARKDTFGPNSYLTIPGFSVAVKTGTTDDKRDNWTVGYTPSVAVGAWVGNNDNSPMNQALASGVTGAAPIWNRIMRTALSGKTNEPFVRPGNIIEMDIDAYGGGTPVSSAATRKERFIKGTEPTGPGYIYKNVKVSRHDNNKLANAVEIGNGQYDLKQYVVFAEQDPVSTDGHNRWQEAIDAWVAGQGDSKFHPPTDTYQGTDQIGMNVQSPKDMTRVDSNSVTVDVTVATLNDLDRVEIALDGSIVKTVHDKNVNVTLTVANGSHIIHLDVADNKGNHVSTDLHVGINQDYAASTPTPTTGVTPTP
ncbi:MAG: PBP1A family penicillin-binding protein [Candidatus Gottesmanbacteria bacterium]|nr:PBP1A family penicillin-binding protein [Candidatus Gottesmanbacteria bacterium]